MQRSGTGLGMTVIWARVKGHSSCIDVTSREGSGCGFEICRPATRERIAMSPAHPVPKDLVGDKTIPAVDDVAGQRDITRPMLSRLVYAIATASSGEEAVAYQRDRRVDLVVLVMIMPPAMDGVEAYRRIITNRPGQKAVIANAFSEDERVAEI